MRTLFPYGSIKLPYSRFIFTQLGTAILLSLCMVTLSQQAMATGEVCSNCRSTDFSSHNSRHMCKSCYKSYNNAEFTNLIPAGKIAMAKTYVSNRYAAAKNHASNSAQQAIDKTKNMSLASQLECGALAAGSLALIVGSWYSGALYYTPIYLVGAYVAGKLNERHHFLDKLEHFKQPAEPKVEFKKPVYVIAKEKLAPIKSVFTQSASDYEEQLTQDPLSEAMNAFFAKNIHPDRLVVALTLSMQWHTHPTSIIAPMQLENEESTQIVEYVEETQAIPKNETELAVLLDNKQHPFLQNQSLEVLDPKSEENNLDAAEEWLSEFMANEFQKGNSYSLIINPVGIINFHQTEDGAFFIYDTISGSQFKLLLKEEAPKHLAAYLVECIRKCDDSRTESASETPITVLLFGSVDS